MHKTLHRTSHPSTKIIPGKGTHTEQRLLGPAGNDLRGFWEQAANELLQPRPEAVASLLEKISQRN